VADGDLSTAMLDVLAARDAVISDHADAHERRRHGLHGVHVPFCLPLLSTRGLGQ